MKYTEYDVSSIEFKPPSNTSFGGKSVPLERPLIIQTPLVYVDHHTVNTYDGRPTTKLHLNIKDIKFRAVPEVAERQAAGKRKAERGVMVAPRL